MERFNFKLLSQFWAIAKSYWFSEEKWHAQGLLLLVIVLSLVYTGLNVLLNNQRGALISALSAQDEARFWHVILIFTLVLVAYAPQFAGYVYLRDRLGLNWRRWLTNHFIDHYFDNHAYYDLNSGANEIDNPDQRIAEDVRSFTSESLNLALVFIESLLAIAAFGGVLWGISPNLVLFLVLYALVGTLATVGVFGKALVRLNFAQLKKEADFRFSLVRIRENAEAIAFYQGEEQESSQVKNHFMAAFENYKRLLLWQLNLNVLTNAYEFIPFILPALVVAPSIFAGDLEVGKVSEAQGAFIRIFFSLNLIVARFQELTTFGAGIDRLQTFATYLETTKGHESSEATPLIQRQTQKNLELNALTVMTPNYQRTLVKNLTWEFIQSKGLLVKGPSGCGKSSLLRAIAGVWNSGHGTINCPPQRHILFLPQRPYMIVGTLREQLLYPNMNETHEDDKLIQILKTVNLPELHDRFGGLDAQEDWASVLSLGEQQRLTFARLFLNAPDYVILDEATSALDLQNEAALYAQLQNTNTTYLSVGHRATLAAYHHHTLELAEDHSWTIAPVT